uniref:Uncharacterized protein n=1 Tax=Rhizophora mucronata TaxID=61149 RepID=A0A2P2L9J7_RHIMU
MHNGDWTRLRQREQCFDLRRKGRHPNSSQKP